jgi:hypothetical protein
MSFVKENELAEFIESKRSIIRKLVIKDVLINYAKILKDTIITTYKRFYNPTWTFEAVTIITHVFWQVIYYSYNIKLAMFLSDRALILFNEYIDLAKLTYTNNADFNINRTDIKIFIYKRTIGPIKIKNIKSNSNKSILEHLTRIKYVSNLFRQIIVNVFMTLIQYYEYNSDFPASMKDEYILQYIDYSIKIYIHILYKLSLHYNYNIILQDWNILTSILHKLNDVNHEFLYYFNLFLNITKIELELIYYTTKKYKQLKLEYDSKIVDILNYIRTKVKLEDIFNLDRHKNIFKELCVLLADEQLHKIQNLEFYKIQKKNIIEYHN